MLKKTAVLCWDQIEHDLYEENGHVFGVELDLFNNHIYFYHRQGLVYDYLSNGHNDIYEAIEEFNQMVADTSDEKYGRWIYWDGWCSNHNLRIDDAVCSECGYKHPMVYWQTGDPRGKDAYQAVLDKLANICPACGILMRSE